MTLIDLGEMSAFPESPAGSGPPPWVRRIGIPARGKAFAAVAAAVLAGGMAGSPPAAVPDPPAHTIAAVDPQGSFWSIGDVVVMANAGPQVVTAIDLVSGEILWSRALSAAVWRMDRFGDLMIFQNGATAVPPGTGDQLTIDRAMAETGTVVALDPRTGEQRWSRPGTLLSPFGARELFALRPNPGPDGGWRLVALDPRDGRDRWTMPLGESIRWTFAYDNEYQPVTGGLLLLDEHDGSVMSVGPGGTPTTLGRIGTGLRLEWAWSKYLAVSRAVGPGPTDGPEIRRFELHDLRTLTATPLWTAPMDGPNGYAPWPCGQPDRLCEQVGNLTAEVSIRDGHMVGTHAEPMQFEQTQQGLGPWSVIGQLPGPQQQMLVAVSPSLSKTGTAWLGVARVRDGRPEVTPLMPTEAQLVNCWTPDTKWIVCSGVRRDGQPWDRSLVLLQSDVDARLAQLRRP